MKSALPKWLRAVWFCSSPIGFLFAARVAWEKTYLRWSHGTQAVGFSLFHVHPLFAVVGVLCVYVLMLWLVLATVLVALHWGSSSKADGAMIAFCVLVTLAVVVP